MAIGDILTRIENLAESLVLSEGLDAGALAGQFADIGALAAEQGRERIAEAARHACRLLEESAATGKPDRMELVRVLGETVSAFQDVFVNGRDADEIVFFREAEPLTATAAPSSFVDKKILSDFLARQDGVMEDFESLILGWEKVKDMDAMREILRLLHTVKGETALLGLSEPEALCHAMEGYLGGNFETVKVDLLLEAKDWFLQVFRYHSNRGVEPAPVATLLAKLAAAPNIDAALSGGLSLSAWVDLPEGADADIVTDFIAESRDHLETADLKIMSLETDPQNQDAMNAVFRAFHSMKGVAAFLGLEGIRTLAHEVETLLDMVRGGKLAASGPLVDLLLESVDALRKLVSVLQHRHNGLSTQEQADTWNDLLARVRSVVAGSSEPMAKGSRPAPAPSGAKLGEILVNAGAVSPEVLKHTLEFQERCEGSRRLGELLVSQGAVPALAVSQALRSQKAPGEEPQADRTVVAVKETVKVEADRLDRLLDAIGELVIAESMIVQSNELRGKVTPLMAQRLSHLDKITRGLQQMGTSLRMVPIRPVFQKMARLVRDLAKKQGKVIEFITLGDETELDKTVVEKIGDPLVHMVRNAIDHGIETDSAHRTAAGKPAAASVRLSAFQKGGNICIKLEDDGRGLNREAILNKARENGLIKDDAVLEDREVWQLIFEPGFSTAKVVTETSGRGVGMDVVKRNVEELRGRIDIQSQAGVGTTFSIWLPLTLAIIDGMIVRLGKERFIFPTLSILRIVPLVKEEIYTVVDEGEMLKLQDEMIPLMRLKQLFPGFESSGWSRLAVIVESDGKKLGIPVDELMGQQQIVIKGLGESFKNIAGLTGGAILSDGNVGMIIDVDGLMKSFDMDTAQA